MVHTEHQGFGGALTACNALVVSMRRFCSVTRVLSSFCSWASVRARRFSSPVFRAYVRTCTAVKGEWLVELAPHYSEIENLPVGLPVPYSPQLPFCLCIYSFPLPLCLPMYGFFIVL